jgi:DNA-directed RNA polymerase specialized sigma24 family protein
MPVDPVSLDSSFGPEELLNPQSAALFERISGVIDGQPRESAAAGADLIGRDGMLEKIAVELYRVSSMLLGEGEEAIALIEDVVARIDLQDCSSHDEALHLSRLLLAAEAISVLRKRDSANNPRSLAAPAQETGPVGCIEDDDLSAAGVTPDELEQMISGPEAHRLRDWLEGLSVSLRVVFVLRAVADLSSVEVATALAKHGGSAAQGWTTDAVRSSFRQALCSLASQLVHATASR